MKVEYENGLFFDDSHDMPDQRQLQMIEYIIHNDLLNSGVHSAIIIDRAGNIISKFEEEIFDFDLYALAALASANYAAVETMARLIGEEDFSLLFHKGKDENIHFSKINDEYLLITIFGKDVSLGLLRLRIEKVVNKLKNIL